MRRATAPAGLAAMLLLVTTAPSLGQSASPVTTTGTDPLPSWNDGALKDRILAFVDSVTTEGGADFVPVKDRVAAFDIDGTLWAERPYYLDAQFAADRVRALAADHPEWAHQLPYAPVVAGDYGVIDDIASTDFIRMMLASYGDMSDADWAQTVRDWFRTTTNPALGRPEAADAYQPMVELLALLKAKGFTNYLVTGAYEPFIRAVSEEIFDVPPQRVIGNEMVLDVTEGDDGTVVSREPTLAFDTWGPGKVARIIDDVGIRPILAAGNSDGDYDMMRWTTSADGTQLALLVQHDDGDREFLYDRAPKLTTAAVGSDPEWAAVPMKESWSTVFSNP